MHEIETYNAFVPGQHELCATAMIEYPDAVERDRMLVELAGVEKHFYLNVDGKKLHAASDPRGVAGDRTTAVHYLSFRLGPDSAKRLQASAGPVYVGVDHPRYDVRQQLSSATLASLREDLNEPSN